MIELNDLEVGSNSVFMRLDPSCSDSSDADDPLPPRWDMIESTSSINIVDGSSEQRKEASF